MLELWLTFPDSLRPALQAHSPATIHLWADHKPRSALGKIKPFVQFLMGATRGSFTGADAQFGGDFSLFTIGAGGGVDVGINRWIAVRGQADWLQMGSPFSSNTARTSVGLVFRF
jgi:hypothetical protein